MTPYLRAANVKDGRLDLDDVKSMNFDPNERRLFGLIPGDVLVTEGAGSLNAVGAAAVWNGELDPPVCYQNTLVRLRPRTGMDGRFLAWWTQYAYGSRLFASVAGGANIFHLSAARLKDLPVWIPGLTDQLGVVDYLDRETERIDALVEKKRRLIELLEEKRTALISHVVTKGLDPTVPMKDSGIPWLGTIPAHWRISKLTRHVRIAEGQVDPTLEPYASMPLLAPNHIQSGSGLLSGVTSAAQQAAISGKYLCRRGDVTMRRSGPRFARSSWRQKTVCAARTCTRWNHLPD